MSRIRKRWGTSVDPDLLEKFKQLSDKTRINMSLLLDEAIEDLIEKYAEKGVIITQDEKQR